MATFYHVNCEWMGKKCDLEGSLTGNLPKSRMVTKAWAKTFGRLTAMSKLG